MYVWGASLRAYGEMGQMENELLKRKPLRYKNFDYNQIGVYCITLCTNQKQQILSSVGATFDGFTICFNV